MAKYLKKKKKKPAALILVIVLVVLILLAAFAVFVMPQLLYRLSGGEDDLSQPAQTVPSASETTEPTEPTLSFPLSLDDGRLEIRSLFPFSGINPDCGNQEGTDIAAIELTNTSGAYLTRADVTLALPDGTQLSFKVTGLPAGTTAMAFSGENRSISADTGCVSAECDASYDGTAAAESDKVSVSVSGTTLTVVNTTAEPLSQIVIDCRSPLGDEYFGGMTYSYTVNDLPAGATATVDAVDCIMGIAEVVRIAVQ